MAVGKRWRNVACVLAAVVGVAMLSIPAAPVAAQGDPRDGTWRLNLEKSTFHFSQAPRSLVHTYEPFGTDGVKASADVVDADGKKIHSTYSLKFDGKFYPVAGDPARDMTALERIDDYTGKGATMKDGKVINTSRHVLSKDGKTFTVTLNGAMGTDIRVYEKQ
jgi:hypothetical protein